MPDIQDGNYGLWLKTLENGKEVWRPMQGAGTGGADLSAYATRKEVKAKFDSLFTFEVFIHVNPRHVNASDTLDDDRGSENKPFATLTAAIFHAAKRYHGNTNVYFYLHADQVLHNVHMGHGAYAFRILAADGTSPTLKLSGTTYFYAGCFNLSGLKIDITESDNGLYAVSNTTAVSLDICNCEIAGASGKHILFLNGNGASGHLACDCVFSGPALSAVYVANGARFDFGHNTHLTLNGEFTDSIILGAAGSSLLLFHTTVFDGNPVGKKYRLIYGSKLVSWGSIMDVPGTIAGTCDESSIVA